MPQADPHPEAPALGRAKGPSSSDARHPSNASIIRFVEMYEADDVIGQLEAAERDYRSMKLQGVA
ncbi:MAG: hypothetical protein P4L82_16735 [Ancalomicrobiaceae bacterium]|nr:hypothetical protein [Ancalomicrobiaceae bacterium]